MEDAWTRLPKTHVEDATSPIAAEGFSPKLPTMAASIYCIKIEEICAIAPGILRAQTKLIFCLKDRRGLFFNKTERSKFFSFTTKSYHKIKTKSQI